MLQMEIAAYVGSDFPINLKVEKPILQMEKSVLKTYVKLKKCYQFIARFCIHREQTKFLYTPDGKVIKLSIKSKSIFLALPQFSTQTDNLIMTIYRYQFPEEMFS